MAQPVERNLGLDLVRVTETAALGAARWLGRGDNEAADLAAVDGMRRHLKTIDIDGRVVIGEGEKDAAPMLFNGERVGSGSGLVVDVAVDPLEGTTLTADGLGGAIAVMALSEGRGSMYAPGSLVYMDKIAVGPESKGLVDLEAPVADNLAKVAKANAKSMDDLRCIVLNRPRNQQYVDAARVVGARISMISAGDVAGAIATAQSENAADILIGIGGSPEAVLAAAALKCLGGEIQAKLWPRDDEERAYAADAGLDLGEVMSTDDLVASDNVFFGATGVTGGEFLDPVQFLGHDKAVTHSVMMRSKTGSIRFMEATHDLARLTALDEPID